MIIFQLVTVIIERILYLRRMHLCKIFFQIVMVIVFHVYLFIVLPMTTKRYGFVMYTCIYEYFSNEYSVCYK